VFKMLGLIVGGALLLLAGCSTEPGGSVPSDWTAGEGVKPAPVPLAPSRQPLIQTNVAPLAIRTNPPAANFNPPPPVYTWTSLNRWATAKAIGPVRRLTSGPTTRFVIDSKRGLLVLEIGSREAIWRGLAFHLGFAPEIIDDQVFVHGLDLQKNLEPLMLGHPLTFGTNRVIVIDPGHGGVNGGTLSVLDKRPEKEFTLDWARRLKPLLARAGWQVVLTRTNDVDIALSNRVAIADAHHADLFISLHFNSLAPDPKPVGLETFCLTPTGMPSTLTRGYPDLLVQNFPNNNFDAQNLQLAEQLQRTLLQATALEDRGVSRARFIGVLRGQRRPAVLIEAGFLSNPREAGRIEDPGFRQRLAEAVAEALK
jgi:N-acetylmuramoyl-L-alanine amidase